MASYTPNYNLKKPADADTYDIADANGNMDLIDTALHSQNQAIAIHKNDIASLDELKTELLAFVGNLSANDTRRYAFWVGGSSTPFSAGYIYSGTIYVTQKSSSVTRFNAIFSNDNGQSVVVGYNNGTWSIQSIDEAIASLNSGKLNRYAYTILGNKGVKIGYDANMPVIISVQRPNAYARLILVGGGYGGEWIRNDFVELISSPAYTWCLSSGGGIDVMNSSGNDANLQVISPGSITFTEITALSGTADTSHAVALKSDVGDSSRIIKFTGTTQSTQSLSPSPNNYAYLMAILLASDGTTVVGTAYTTPEVAAAYTIKVYGESSSQWGSFKLSSDYSQGTFNRTSSNTESISLYGVIKK